MVTRNTMPRRTVSALRDMGREDSKLKEEIADINRQLKLLRHDMGRCPAAALEGLTTQHHCLSLRRQRLERELEDRARNIWF